MSDPFDWVPESQRVRRLLEQALADDAVLKGWISELRRELDRITKADFGTSDARREAERPVDKLEWDAVLVREQEDRAHVGEVVEAARAYVLLSAIAAWRGRTTELEEAVMARDRHLEALHGAITSAVEDALQALSADSHSTRQWKRPWLRRRQRRRAHQSLSDLTGLVSAAEHRLPTPYHHDPDALRNSGRHEGNDLWVSPSAPPSVPATVSANASLEVRVVGNTSAAETVRSIERGSGELPSIRVQSADARSEHAEAQRGSSQGRPDYLFVIRAGASVAPGWFDRLRAAAGDPSLPCAVRPMSPTDIVGRVAGEAGERAWEWLVPEGVSLLSEVLAPDAYSLASPSASCWLFTSSALEQIRRSIAAHSWPAPRELADAATKAGVRLLVAGSTWLREPGQLEKAVADGKPRVKRVSHEPLVPPLLIEAIETLSVAPAKLGSILSGGGRTLPTVLFVVSSLSGDSRVAAGLVRSEARGMSGLGLPAAVAIGSPVADPAENERVFSDIGELRRIAADADVVVAVGPPAMPLVAALHADRDFLPVCYVHQMPEADKWRRVTTKQGPVSAEAGATRRADAGVDHLHFERLPEAVIMAASGSIAEELYTRHGVAARTAEVGVDDELFSPRPDEPGSHGRLQIVARAAAAADPLGLLEVLQLVRQRLEGRVAISTFGPPLPRSEGDWEPEQLGLLAGRRLADVFGCADIFLHVDPNDALGRQDLAAMACGAVPVVAIGSETAKMLRDEEACVEVDPRELGSWVEVIVALANDWRRLRRLQLTALRTARARGKKRAAVAQYALLDQAHRQWIAGRRRHGRSTGSGPA